MWYTEMHISTTWCGYKVIFRLFARPSTLRKKIYSVLESLHENMDKYIGKNDFVGAHKGKRCQEKTLMLSCFIQSK